MKENAWNDEELEVDDVIIYDLDGYNIVAIARYKDLTLAWWNVSGN